MTMADNRQFVVLLMKMFFLVSFDILFVKAEKVYTSSQRAYGSLFREVIENEPGQSEPTEPM